MGTYGMKFGASFCLRNCKLLGYEMFVMAEGEKIINKIITSEDGSDSKNNMCQSSVKLSEYLKSNVSNILSQVEEEQFVSVYKTLYKEFEKKDEIIRPSLSGSSTEGRKYHTQFNDIIMRSVSKTIDETILNMDFQLKELEELKSSLSENKIQWRPPGNASQHMIPFELMSELEKKKKLESKIEKEQEELCILKARLNQKRCKAEELNEVVLSLIEEIKCSVTSKINGQLK